MGRSLPHCSWNTGPVGHQALGSNAAAMADVGVRQALAASPKQIKTAVFGNTDRSGILDPDLGDECGEPERVERKRCHGSHRCARIAISSVLDRGPPTDQGCLATLIDRREADFTHARVVDRNHPVDSEEASLANCAALDPTLCRGGAAFVGRLSASGDRRVVPGRGQDTRILCPPSTQRHQWVSHGPQWQRC